MSNTTETLNFFYGPIRHYGMACLKKKHRLGVSAAEMVFSRHIGVCFDTAHSAVEFAGLAEDLLRLKTAGVSALKIHLSATPIISSLLVRIVKRTAERMSLGGGNRPFRLGAPSYVIPADIVPNVEFLAPRVDDVEILIMESDELSALPSDEVIAALKKLAEAHDLTYTVHLPLDIAPGSADDGIRRRSVEKIVRAAQAVSELQPFAYVLHLPLPDWRTTREDDRRRWRQCLSRSIREILAQGIEAERLCVETLDYPFEWVEDLIDTYGLSVCVDVGHLILEGRNVPQYLDRYWPRVRILHLHGVVDGKDHRAVSHLDHELLSMILFRFTNGGEHERVITLEVFDRARLEESMDAMERLQ